MNTFFIADTHFHHNNIIKYCNRPFTTVDEMDEQLIKNWNSVVKNGDIVYHLGDFCIGSIKYTEEVLSRLKGRIFLVSGNHDDYSMKRYYEAGFEKVYDHPIIIDQFWILSHYPMFMTESMPYVNIFGHVHNNPEYSDYSKCHFCVSAERIKYTPISFDAIKEIVEKQM